MLEMPNQSNPKSKNTVMIIITLIVLTILLGVYFVTKPNANGNPQDSENPDGSTNEDQETSNDQLEGTKWRLTSYSFPSTPIPSEVTITSEFANNTISGSGGCNSYSGNYTTDGNMIFIGDLASTAMFCDVASEYEAMFMQTLMTITTYEVKGDTLTMSDSSNNVMLTYSRQN